jgi:chemotaxis protein methyltransferase CheR
MSRVVLTDEEFARLASLLHDLAGLSFDEPRRESLTFCVVERMRSTGCADVPSYLALLSGSDGSEERQALLDEVTVPETHFFRNPPQIRALRAHVIPELLRQAAGSRRLRIWSAGCATGEEAYTVAMLVRELLPASAGWDVKILATDVSTRALDTAVRGTYTDRSFVMTDPVDLARWFVLDVATGSFGVRQEVRDLVEFRHHNLVTELPPFTPGEVDLVLCRNVTIYFARRTTRTLMQRLHSSLRDGGYLFLGHAETLWQVSDDFSLVSMGDAFVYRRLDPQPGEPERRVVVRERRTEDEPRPTRADRRRGELGRRGRTSAAAGAAPPGPPALDRSALDPLDAVRVALDHGRYAEAADLALEVSTATPLCADAYYLHGLALTSLGRDADAVVVLRKAVYVEPDHGFAYFLLAGAMVRLEEPVAAARCYRAAATTLGRAPEDAVAVELGGRRVAELAAVCAHLAGQAEAVARWESGPGDRPTERPAS